MLDKIIQFYKSLAKREKIVFWTAVSVLLLFSVNHFVARPYQRLVEDFDQDVLTRRIRLAKYRRLVGFKDQAEKMLQTLSSAKVRTAQEEMAVLLKELEGEARKAGVRIQDIKPLAPEETDFYRKDIVELSADAKTRTLAEFLYGLQTSGLFLKVSKMRLASIEDEAGASKLRAHLVISRIVILPK